MPDISNSYEYILNCLVDHDLGPIDAWVFINNGKVSKFVSIRERSGHLFAYRIVKGSLEKRRYLDSIRVSGRDNIRKSYLHLN